MFLTLQKLLLRKAEDYFLLLFVVYRETRIYSVF
jgi:hypothetical protein